MKIITGLHKTYKNNLSEKVQPFVEIIGTIYDNMDKTVHDVFSDEEKHDNNNSKDESPATTGGFNEETPTKTLNKAMFSFKTLAECPITMVSLYQSYKQLVSTSLPQFLPRIIHILELQIGATKTI